MSHSDKSTCARVCVAGTHAVRCKKEKKRSKLRKSNTYRRRESEKARTEKVRREGEERRLNKNENARRECGAIE